MPTTLFYYQKVEKVYNHVLNNLIHIVVNGI
jgi:hypothetical protein